MFSCEQDHTAAARTTFTTTGYQPCAAPRSLQPAAHQPGQHQLLPAAAAVQPRRAKNKKHGASRRSSTTLVAADANNFRAIVQELTGLPAGIFRPLPRRVHAARPFVAAASACGAGQGCSGSERHGHGGSEATNNCTAGGGSSSPDAPAAQAAVLQPTPQRAPVFGVFDALMDLGSPEFDSWGDLSIE